MSDGGWPNPEQPGVPMHPEQDGWHWLADDRKPQPVLWIGEYAAWADGTMHSAQGVVDLGFTYLGPCLPPAEVAAQVAAARREALEEAARVCEAGWGEADTGCDVSWNSACMNRAAAIRAVGGRDDG